MPAPRRSPPGHSLPDPPQSPPLPRHHTAYLLLRQRLDGMAEHAFLPGEHELAAELGVSRITLRRALSRLEREGRILRRRGDGTRVRRPEGAERAERPADMVAQLLQIGRRTTTEVLGIAAVAASAEVAAGLGLPVGARVRRAEILRRLGELPVSHLAAFFPDTPESRAVTRAALARRALLAVTEEIGGPVRELSQAIGCVLADAPLALLLGVPAGAPLLRVERRFLGRRAPLQFSVAHYRADCMAIETVERRGGAGRRCEIRMRLAERDGASG